MPSSSSSTCVPGGTRTIERPRPRAPSRCAPSAVAARVCALKWASALERLQVAQRVVAHEHDVAAAAAVAAVGTALRHARLAAERHAAVAAAPGLDDRCERLS